ncbi:MULTISPECIES: FtsX-like permease family protein [unclassified Lacticaseibacillus]|uniref:FtsX-like permease family protein n=1 Tax=unclassified Lacticaseibacillus TaxID=2759744 RepID=UPI00194356F6|nr:MULTISPECIES: ABC transporter permease [unclassified Lacticaseibacillus]
MLRKLALGGIRSRFRDYAVLFSGLVIGSAVFYMFLSLATNKAFLTANTMVGMTSFIFGFGEVLLVIITTVYIVYANSFLMSMRQRDYAMFMMLGAKSRKIAQLIFIETVTVGVLAAVVGIALGMGLTGVAGHVLMAQLHAPATHFSVVWPPAIMWTFVFFLLMFVVGALINAHNLLKTPLLDLLHAATTPNRLKTKKWVLGIQAVLAVVLLAIGYWAMSQLAKLVLAGIAIALVTIVLGSYFLFNALLVWLIGLLKKNKRFAAKGLHTFTLSQLSFRIRDYTRILAVVSILFALALGAITVGLGFEHDIPDLASKQNAYDTVVVDPNAATMAKARQLTGVKAQINYHLKQDAKHVYFNASELDRDPVLVVQFARGPVKFTKLTAANFAQKSGDYDSQLGQFLPAKAQGKQLAVLTASQFAALTSPVQTAHTWRLKDFTANYDQLSALNKAIVAQYGKESTAVYGQKFTYYDMINGAFSGMAFMGFFLGIAFLAMLASTLMFKILSGASYDQSRYLMLQKIGVRPGLLRKSVRQEIGALFFFPGLLGVIHVLFGLKMFVGLLQEPYGHLLLPFGLFLVLYAVYYLLTVWLYERIVIQKDIATD